MNVTVIARHHVSVTHTWHRHNHRRGFYALQLALLANDAFLRLLSSDLFSRIDGRRWHAAAAEPVKYEHVTAMLSD